MNCTDVCLMNSVERMPVGRAVLTTDTNGTYLQLYVERSSHVFEVNGTFVDNATYTFSSSFRSPPTQAFDVPAVCLQRNDNCKPPIATATLMLYALHDGAFDSSWRNLAMTDIIGTASELCNQLTRTRAHLTRLLVTVDTAYSDALYCSQGDCDMLVGDTLAQCVTVGRRNLGNADRCAPVRIPPG